jgi:hypothetical protein
MSEPIQPSSPAGIAHVPTSTLPADVADHLESFYKEHVGYATDAIRMVSVCMQQTQLATNVKQYTAEAKSYAALAELLDSWTLTFTRVFASVQHSAFFPGEHALSVSSDVGSSLSVFRTALVRLASYAHGVALCSDACMGKRFLFWRRAPALDASGQRLKQLQKLNEALKEYERLLISAESYNLKNLPVGMDLWRYPRQLLEHWKSFV